MKKVFLLLILIFLSIFCESALANGDIFSFSFESEAEVSSWSGCFFEGSDNFGSGGSIFLANPFGPVRGDKVSHVLEYVSTVSLEAGNVYTIKGYAINPLSAHSPNPRANARLESGANTIVVNIGGIGDEPAEFSATFYAGESGEYNLSLIFDDGFVDFGFFVDELSFSRTPCTISQLALIGQSRVLIPAEGSSSIHYYPFLLTSQGEAVGILSPDALYITSSQADGVSFDPADLSLTISSDAKNGEVIKIECALRTMESLPPFSLSVEFFDNMLENPGFDDGPPRWTSSSTITVLGTDNNSYISVPTNDYGEFGYFTTLSYDAPQLLLEGVVYVLRAKVKSDSDLPSSTIYAKNTAENIGDTIFFNITDVPGNEWKEVFAAFVPETSGIYSLALNLYSTYDCTISVDDVRLSSETLHSSYLTLHAPGNISLPDIKTSYAITALLRDQLGNILGSDGVTIFLKENVSSVSFDSATNTLTVLPDAPVGEYTLCAYYEYDSSISTTLPFTISFDYIGDGGFEEKIPNEWWMATSPYKTDFYIRDDGVSKRALINCSGDYFMFLNNSYSHLIENMAYVFNGSFAASVDCTATLFIEAVDSQLHPLAQFAISSRSTLEDTIAPALFLAENSCVGRLFLYIQSDDMSPFSIYADNLSLKKAVVIAGSPHISGEPFVNGAVTAEFSFYNSLLNNSDTSASIINWYVSDTTSYDGFKMLYTSGANIYFDTTFFNKYVYFEVIPVCPLTGFSGESVKCLPFLITYPDSANSPSGKNFFTIPDLEESSAPEKFSDISSHWGKDYINTFAEKGFIDGKTHNTFVPDAPVSRAEFSKIICNAFSITPYADFIPYNDIHRNDWYYSSVCALTLNGIVSGISNSEFAPDAMLTREDSAVIIMRLYDKIKKGKTSYEHTFTDSDTISGYATSSVNEAYALGIVKGKGDNSFAPKEPLTRAQAVTVIYNLISVLKAH